MAGGLTACGKVSDQLPTFAGEMALYVYGDEVSVQFLPGEEVDVDEQGPFVPENHDDAYSRCPDEVNPFGNYVQGRTFTISGPSPKDTSQMVRFTIDGKLLTWQGYLEQGAVNSFGRYSLRAEVVSDGVPKWVAPVGAIVHMRCRGGRYIGAGLTRVYGGVLRLEHISPVHELLQDPCPADAIDDGEGGCISSDYEEEYQEGWPCEEDEWLVTWGQFY